MSSALPRTSAALPTGRDARRAAEALRPACSGAVHLPGDPGYDAARVPWNLAVDLRPAAVAFPATTAEVSGVVRAAAGAGLRVAVQGTGHNAAALGSLDDVVLLRTSAMTGVRIDPFTGIARVQAGTLWKDVVAEAARHGVSVLHGSSPDVGVVGYSLGGGLGWYARRHGLQANAVTAADVVLWDGSVARADAEHHADLFWALRGGGGSFGAVTALDFRTYRFNTAYAGMLVWDWQRAAEVLARWAVWSVEAPDSVTTSFRILQVPPAPGLPEALRGRQVAVIDGAVLADDAGAAEVLAPLRSLRPEIDTFARTGTAALARLHLDPEGPTPVVSASTMLAELPPDAVEAFLAAAGPGSGSSLLTAELRQLGGALSRPPEGAGALPLLDGRFLVCCAAIPMTPEVAARGAADARRVVEAVRPWASGSVYLNVAEGPVDVAAAYGADVWRRLRQVRAAADPHGVFVANHPVPAAGVPQQRP